MSMTVVVTRNASSRMRGFLASIMLEVAPGVYSAPRISPAVRERIWEVIEDWSFDTANGSFVMLWYDKEIPGGQAVRILGSPPLDFVDVDGLIVTRRNLQMPPNSETSKI